MAKIYELYGYHETDRSENVEKSRKRTECPFSGGLCDGGGNRFMSNLDLSEHPELREYFVEMDDVPSGICSIQLSPGEPPWIICPRRLFYMGKHATEEIMKGHTQSVLMKKCNFLPGTTVGVWAETKIKYQNTSDEEDAVFDYTFDYVLVSLGRVSLEQLSTELSIPEKIIQKQLECNGFTLSMRNGLTSVEDFPIGPPIIIEIMTSSTSGGNKKKRSCIPQAFEDCILDRPHIAPGINYRQVWARMASQMIVKSQAALEWGGSTIWILQDLLSEYISSSTALDLRKFVNENISEVNVLEFSYGDRYHSPELGKTVEISDARLYSGPIRSGAGTNPSFQDIVLASVCPPKDVLIRALLKKQMSNKIIIK
jgi:Restriction endonuclease NotI.